jgi:hypothetical protein
LISQLGARRIGFVSAGADDLFAAAQLGFESPQFKSLVEVIARKTVEGPSLARVTVEFFVRLWDAGIPQIRDRLISAVLEAILTRPDAMQLIRVVVVAVDRNLRARPFPQSLLCKLWNDYVECFITGHFIRSELVGR